MWPPLPVVSKDLYPEVRNKTSVNLPPYYFDSVVWVLSIPTWHSINTEYLVPKVNVNVIPTPAVIVFLSCTLNLKSKIHHNQKTGELCQKTLLELPDHDVSCRPLINKVTKLRFAPVVRTH
jgi:hypothetical protein